MGVRPMRMKKKGDWLYLRTGNCLLGWRSMDLTWKKPLASPTGGNHLLFSSQL
ncbi:hypothetical protein Taro_024309 [Colocasia esculenta]|uniref:Uncharacterized protein n=1 Tax=Colocasia esculenta TaxID=4460 RepID=A0A843V6G7_COLES|nr:hypothetical protein [Colocasia esculenta]